MGLCVSENDDDYSVRKDAIVMNWDYISNGTLGRSISGFKHTNPTQQNPTSQQPVD